jgi:outer membrane protein W
MYCYESWRGSLTFEQWHFASYIGKKILKASPYLGVRYSDMHIQDKSRAGALLLLDILALDVVNSTSDYKRKLKADNNFGVFVGTDYNITKNFKLNLETHFIDEYSLKFGGTFNF